MSYEEENVPKSSDWCLLANYAMNWAILAYQVVIRETYMFPHVIAFPYIVFVFSNISFTMHVVRRHYQKMPLVPQILECLCAILFPIALAISILESSIFFFILWRLPHTMAYYTTVEFGHVARAVFIRLVPLCSNVRIFFSSSMGLGIPCMLFTITFFSIYYNRLCAYLPDNDGKFAHQFLDLMTSNQRICLFTIALPAVLFAIMLVLFILKWALRNDYTVSYYTQAPGSRDWTKHMALAVFCVAICIFCMRSQIMLLVA